MDKTAVVEGQLDQEAAAFDAAFDTAVEVPPEKIEQEMQPEPEKKPEVPAGEPAAPVAAAPVVNAEVTDDAPFEQKWKTLQGIYRHEKDEWSVEKAKLAQEIEELKQRTPVPETKPEVDEQLKKIMDEMNLTDDEKAQLAEYDTEFDIVSKMEGLKRKTELAKLKIEIREMLDGMKSEFSTQFKPTQEFVQEAIKGREEADYVEHFQSIADAHPDFEKYRDDGSIKGWIEAKPSYLRKGMMEVYSQGSAEQVIELIDDFKKENKITATAENVYSMKKSEKRSALTPPVTKRGAVNASMSVANDFEGAFDEALNKLG